MMKRTYCVLTLIFKIQDSIDHKFNWEDLEQIQMNVKLVTHSKVKKSDKFLLTGGMVA